MGVVVANKKQKPGIAVVSKMKDYSQEPVFKKKAEKAAAFIKKHGLTKTSGKKKG